MINIPDKLKKEGVNFVLLEKGGKKPFQMGWQKKEIPYNDQDLIKHIEDGGNYGIMGGGNAGLILVDFDNKEVQDELLDKLPKTFTVKTGSGLLHLYYFSDKHDSFKIFDGNMDTLADIQGQGKQVVGPGSIHPNGNEYELVDDRDIAFIDYAELKAMLMPYDKKPKKEEKKFEFKPTDNEDDFLDVVKSKVSMPNLLRYVGVDTSMNPTACPMHHSKGGKCLGFTREVAHCFHCEDSWNIFSLMMAWKKCDFKEALELLSELGGCRGELDESRKKFKERKKKERESNVEGIKDEIKNALILKQRNIATELIVDKLKRDYFLYSTKDDIKSEMWVYQEGVYKPNGKSVVKEQCRLLLEEAYTTQLANDVISKIETDTMIEHDEFFKNRYVNEIPVENGILDVVKLELKPFDPQKIFFNKLPVKYDSDAKCPHIDKFLKQILSKEEDVEVAYELIGQGLFKDYFTEKAGMLVGSGRNGKSKFLELIKRLVGVENTCSVPLRSMKEDNSSLCELHERLFNLAGDLSHGDLKQLGCFKQTVGRDLIQTHRKFLRDLIFVNYAKHIFACNELPRVYDSSDGFWDKWVLLEFPYKFITQKELDKLPEKEKINKKIKDPEIIEKITTSIELSGLLNMSLISLHRLFKNKNFSQTKGSKEIKDIWIRRADSCAAFCIDTIEESYDGFITKLQFRKRFHHYCKKHNIKGASNMAIKVTLEERYGVSEGRKYLNEQQESVWEGIKFKGDFLN